MPRATTAACEVIPPRAVSTPSAICMPATSSGLVSMRTRTTGSPRAAHSAASSAPNTTRPTAAPGEAPSPCAITRRSAAASKVSWSSSSSFSGSCRNSASGSSNTPSSTRSTAIVTMARPVRLPERVCSTQSLPCWTVNSTSCISPKCSSSRAQAATSSPCTTGMRSSSELPGAPSPALRPCGVRMPATTSSPCAFTRYSPLSRAAPVAGSRVKTTPVAQSSPRLPKTIACTLTAVPQLEG